MIAKTILIESSFFKNLYKQFKDEDRYQLGKENEILTHAWKHVDSVLGEKLIEQSAMTIWEEKRRCQGVQRTLLELMQNTCNHAVIGKEGEKHWWLSVNHRKNDKKVSFSFVDFGIGIFNSLNNKQVGSKFFGWTEKLYKRFKFGDNAELLRLILEGHLHQTVTGEHFRGKGLPGIKEVLNRNQISNLYIITNNVYADISNNNFKTLSTNFSGTFIYWELNSSNRSCNGIN